MKQPSLSMNKQRRPKKGLGLSLKWFLVVAVVALFVTQLILALAYHKKAIDPHPQPVSVAAVAKAAPPNLLAAPDVPTGDMPPLLRNLPEWIQNYVMWHREMRLKFPGDRILTDPQAPNILLRVCLGLCGGLNDRLGQLPWDLYLANQTKRIILMRWERPKPLEDFLIPNLMNWSVPPGLFRTMHDVRNLTQLFEGTSSEAPTEVFWQTDLDRSLERAIHGDFRDIKILRHRILGHLNEDKLEDRLTALGETDTLHYTKSFGNIFWTFFRPHPAIQSVLDGVYQDLHLKPREYTAVHCRVRHPKATPKSVYIKGKNPQYPADKTGLPWHGAMREFAVETGTRALSCARSLSNDPHEPIYFFSDSNDLVRYFSHELRDPAFLKANTTLLLKNPVDKAALEVSRSVEVVAREMSVENAHIDRQKGRPPSAYYATFVDLLLAVNARCITYGIGYYAIFAAKISGISCKLLYQEEEWGGSSNKGWKTQTCTDDMIQKSQSQEGKRRNPPTASNSWWARLFSSTSEVQ